MNININVDKETLSKLNKYNNIEAFEEQILGCLILEPNLMKDLIVKEKHFVKNKSLFKFFVQFYEIHKTLDIVIMLAVCPKNKIKLINKIVEIVDNVMCHTCKFNLYQKYLITLQEEEQKEKLNILKIDDLANKLYLRGITVEEFKKEIEKIMKCSLKLLITRLKKHLQNSLRVSSTLINLRGN